MPRTSDVIDRVVAFNRGREPERLQLKYEAMSSSAFRFLRGSCHLFYEDWPGRTSLDRAPPAWICGDLHLENFGTYKGDDDIIYFDINDFDEAVLAPCTWDVTRLATSVFVAADDYGIGARHAATLVKRLLDGYAEALGLGKARRVERLVSSGMIRRLLDGLLRRTRASLVAQRTERRGGKLRLRTGQRALPATREQRQAVGRALEHFAAAQHQPGFARVLDVARRVAGTGSLGAGRFVVLVEGSDPVGRFLLDVKEARASSIATHTPCRQPRWHNQAERIVGLQDRLQAVAPALLHVVRLGGRPQVVRELQPSEDKLNFEVWRGSTGHMDTAVCTMGRIAAWGHLRSGGRQGSATTDQLMAFAGRGGWQGEVLRYARSYAGQVAADFKVFHHGARRGRVPVSAGRPFVSDED